MRKIEKKESKVKLEEIMEKDKFKRDEIMMKKEGKLGWRRFVKKNDVVKGI